jgi:hypothetical protein
MIETERGSTRKNCMENLFWRRKRLLFPGNWTSIYRLLKFGGFGK